MSESTASLYRNFLAAAENMRGLMQRHYTGQLLRYEKDEYTSPLSPDFRITGNAGISNEEYRPVRGDAKLDFAASRCFETLTLYMNSLLSSLSPALRAAEKGLRSDLIVGMSGGADSTLVLILACALRDKFGFGAVAVHCIHGLDPDDEIWLNHNRQICRRLNVELRTPVLNIVYGNGVSPEDISRKERYRALLENTSKEKDFLMLGHQADDLTEGFLLALKRGSGPLGLGGMKKVTEDRRGVIIRSLLDLRKSEIEQILISKGFSYVYDLSNGYMKFERNFIRLKVLPLLRERFAGIDGAVLRSVRLCAAEHDLAERYAAEKLESRLISTVFAPYTAFAPEPGDFDDPSLLMMLIRAFLRKVLSEEDLSPDFNLAEQCVFLLSAPNDSNGRLKISGSAYEISTFRQKLYLTSLFNEELFAKPKGRIRLKIGERIRCGNVIYRLQALSAEDFAKDNADKLRRICFRCGDEGVLLCFDVKGSLKFKPRYRAHSKEFRKILAEENTVPWIRPFIPAVCRADVRGELKSEDILSAGNTAAAGESMYSDFADGYENFYILCVEGF